MKAPVKIITPSQLGLVYLATPYSKYESGLTQAFTDAAKLAAKLLMKGMKVYSPIVHCHPLSHFGGINPLNHNLWLPFDEAMMTAAQTLVVAHMEGWEKSYGIEHEIKFFIAAGKPIYDLDPPTLEMAGRRS